MFLKASSENFLLITSMHTLSVLSCLSISHILVELLESKFYFVVLNYFVTPG